MGQLGNGAWCSKLMGHQGYDVCWSIANGTTVYQTWNGNVTNNETTKMAHGTTVVAW